MNKNRQEQLWLWVEEDKETVLKYKEERTEPEIQQGSVLSSLYFEGFSKEKL